MDAPRRNLVCYATLELGSDEPWTLENYLKVGGYQAWGKVLAGELTRGEVIDQLKASGLRGRGGAGFPTGLKQSWKPSGAPGR
jgi:NADH-quinone oxidoreductase subunit F